MANPYIYVKESATPLGQQPKVCETQLPETDLTSQRTMRCGVKETTWDHSTLVNEGHDWPRKLWANCRYTQGKHRPDHMLWGHMNNTAHTRISEKVTKKQVMMFPVIYASQSFSLPRQPFYSTLNHSSCLHLFLWHHPVIIFSLKFLWWKMSHLFLPTQAGACGMPFFWSGILGEDATQRPFQTLFTHHPRKNASEKAYGWGGAC